MDSLKVYSGDIMYKNYRSDIVHENLKKINIRPLDVVITGVTGAGKSTTLNAFFQKLTAKVGAGVDPETMNIDYYSLNDSIRLWDTPGLGDGIENDKKHSRKLVDLFYKKYSVDNNNYGLVDMVLVIIEGSNRDMGTTYKLINEVLVPNFQSKRILVAINQADVAMKGRHWDNEKNEPDQVLLNFLNNKVASIKTRVKEATGVDIITPVYYSAEHNYNIKKLLDLIIDNMSTTKRKLKENYI